MIEPQSYITSWTEISCPRFPACNSKAKATVYKTLSAPLGKDVQMTIWQVSADCTTYYMGNYKRVRLEVIEIMWAPIAKRCFVCNKARHFKANVG